MQASGKKIRQEVLLVRADNPWQNRPIKLGDELRVVEDGIVDLSGTGVQNLPKLRLLERQPHKTTYTIEDFKLGLLGSRTNRLLLHKEGESNLLEYRLEEVKEAGELSGSKRERARRR